jgi:hypothetical protein
MKILESLAAISTSYTVFKKDQVLTHCQLNTISDYLNDQSRLTRMNLMGVGLACGLRPSVQADSTVKVTSGLGITTDGDLLYFNADMVFDKFKRYGESNPQYEPFFANGAMVPVYELVQVGAADARADSLSLFAPNTGKTLDNMVALLFMESYVKDSTLCSGSGCDNLGGDCLNSLKLLLVDKASAGSLQYPVVTANQIFDNLSAIEIDRPLIPATTSHPGTFSKLATIYRATCTVLHAKLLDCLLKLSPLLYRSPFFADVFPSDPSATWNTKLNAIKSLFASVDIGIQYYYDFLKDVAETYNDVRELLFGDNTWCCPDLRAFPKHLLLGNLVSSASLSSANLSSANLSSANLSSRSLWSASRWSANPDDNRTPFYPSPLLSQTMEQLDHAKFLVRKLDTLIQTFQVPYPDPGAREMEIRITPSRSEECPLEERAIPYYYQVNEAYPIHKSWNYRLHKRGMDTRNYSYNAVAYGAQGATADPLSTQIGRFPFFRIEGHLGKKLTDALAIIEAEIKSRNLPFAVRSIMLGSDKTKLVKPGIRYSDLHRFHYLLRQEVSHQLEEVQMFSAGFKEKINTAVADKIVDPAAGEVAYAQDSSVTANAALSRDKLNLGYSDYKNAVPWQITDFVARLGPTLGTTLGATMRSSGEFKSKLGEVLRTEVSTPFDALISNTHVQWMPWLDEVIRIKEEAEDEKLLFTNFIAQHPGIEHFAGVPRGGTFVLVYDDSKNQVVVADFMLPYCCCDTTEKEPQEGNWVLPNLTVRPTIDPDWIKNNVISVLPTRDKFVKDRLESFKTTQLDGIVQGKLDNFKTTQVDRTIQDKLAEFKAKDVDALKSDLSQRIDYQQENYFHVMDNSISLIGNALAGKQDIQGISGALAGVAGAATGVFTDKELGQKVTSAKAARQVVDYYNEKARQPDLPGDVREKYLTQAQEAEKDLANIITDTVNYIDSSKMDVSLGSEGFSAVMEMNTGLAKITTADTAGAVKTNLSSLQDTTINADLKLALGGMLGTIKM